MRLKYIVTDHGDFAIFTELSNHSDVARSLYGKPVGAGFCNLIYAGNLHGMHIQVECFGHSVTLDLESRKEVDAAVINKHI